MTITMNQMIFWHEIVSRVSLTDLLQAAIQNSAQGLSEMVGRPITIEKPHIKTLPIGRAAACVGGPETEMVGVYLLIDGDASGQVILMLPLGEALHLVDLLLGEPRGSTTALGNLERSALAEAGNLMTSFFLNKIALLTGSELRPSPPAVMVDMLGAIVDVIAVPLAWMSDELVLIETAFQDAERVVKAHFWVLPYPEAFHRQVEEDRG